ncbi:MAG: AsmA-like C-terminal region-containing protein [Ferruginibacter sp.]
MGVLLCLYLLVYVYVSTHKQAILTQVNNEVGNLIQGDVSIKDVELNFTKYFPKVSVLLKDVHVTDTMFSFHKHPFFMAEKVFARISVWKLIRKESPLNGISIERGGLYLYTDSTGYTNTYLIQQKNKSKTSTEKSDGKSELKLVDLKDFSVIIDDRQKEKLHNYFVNDLQVNMNDDNDLALLMHANASVNINSMAFNLPRGTFLANKKFTGKFQLIYNKSSGSLQFDSINIKLSGQPFNLSGSFDLKGTAPQFYLRAHTTQLSFNTGKTFLPHRLDSVLSIVALDKPVDVDVNLSGPLRGGEPLVLVNFSAKKTKLKTPFFDFEDATFTGYYTNEMIKDSPRLDPNSIIRVSDFSSTWRGLPLTAGSIAIANLEVPILSCDLHAQFPLTQLNGVMASKALKLQSGDGIVNLTYQGPIIRNNNTNSLINGSVQFKNGTLMYTPRSVAMNDVNGQLNFKNSDIEIKDLRCEVLGNKVTMQGDSKNLLQLMNTEPGKATINWSINAPVLNLTAFKFLLKPAANVRVTDNLATTASQIDDVLEKAILHVNLSSSKLRYNEFNASNVNADVELLANKYILNTVNMNHAGGSIKMSGSLINVRTNYLAAAVKANLNHVDVSTVLKAFENFGQDGITADNLEGKLSADVNATMGVDEEGKVYPASVKSDLSFSLKDGALVNYEPVKKMQNFLFKNRDFENIQFAELKDHFEIANREIKINRMEIQSTAFSFFIEGIYSMAGHTDLSIQVPLSNLKKRDEDYNPENIGVNKKAGSSIFLRGRPGDDGNVSFKLDLFNRYKKEKKRKLAADSLAL